jgi:hypothetical protein
MAELVRIFVDLLSVKKIRRKRNEKLSSQRVCRGVTRGPGALGKRSKKRPLEGKKRPFERKRRLFLQEKIFFDDFLSETIEKACFKPKIFIVFCRKSCFIIKKQ